VLHIQEQLELNIAQVSGDQPIKLERELHQQRSKLTRKDYKVPRIAAIVQ